MKVIMEFKYRAILRVIENTIILSPVAPARGARGGQGGRLPPNVEKDGPRNSSKFDEKIGGGGRYPSQM